VFACLAILSGGLQPSTSRAQGVSNFELSQKKAEMLSRMRATHGFKLPAWSKCAAAHVKESTVQALQIIWLLKRKDVLSHDAVSASSQDSFKQIERCGGNTKAMAVEMEAHGDAVHHALMLATLAAGR